MPFPPQRPHRYAVAGRARGAVAEVGLIPPIGGILSDGFLGCPTFNPAHFAATIAKQHGWTRKSLHEMGIMQARVLHLAAVGS